ADLRNATLRDVDLTGADLRDADLRGATFGDADLTDALLLGAQTGGATWDDVVCPDGSASTAAGGTCAGHLLQAHTFAVTTPTAEVDAHPGDGACDTGTGDCSLRAAIQELDAWPSATAGTVVLGHDEGYLLTLEGAGEDAAHDGDLDITRDLFVVGNGSM